VITVERLADIFVEVADTLTAELDVVEFLHRVAGHVSAVSGDAVVGVVLIDEDDRPQHLGASHDDARALELFQLQEMEGPCVDCFRSGEPVVNLDLETAGDRWPTFAPVAASRGLRSVHAIPLRFRDRVLGALNVFGTDEGVLAEDEVRVIAALADVATLSLVRERAIARAEVVNEQLQSALASRVVIEQAKGVVARTFHVTVDEAFSLIRTHARRERTGLADLCRRIVAAPETISRLRTD